MTNTTNNIQLKGDPWKLLKAVVGGEVCEEVKRRIDLIVKQNKQTLTSAKRNFNNDEQQANCNR